MSWNIEFVGQLNNDHILTRYKLMFIGVLNALGRPFSIYCDSGKVQIAQRSIRISGTRITPQRWSVSFGGFSLDVSGDIREILPSLRRGQIAILQVSINGTGYKNLAIGSLDTLSGQRGLFSLGFKDLLSTLQNSLDTRAGTVFSTTDPPRFSLFYEVGQTTTTTSQFSDTATTLNLTDASFFKKASYTNAKGIVKCINDGSGGDNTEFYIFWTGSTSTTLTGCTTANYGNTSRVTLVSGSTVKYCAWLEGQPYEILGSILTSTGDATNGELDVYPIEWSIGGKIPKEIFDISDSKRASKEIKRSDSDNYDLGIAIESPLSNGLRYLVDIFLTVGIFPVYRQDGISIRCCTDPEGIETRKKPDLRAQISDYDIIDVISHEFFSTDISNIYRTTKVKYNYTNFYYSGGKYNGGRVDSLPALSDITRDFSQYYLANPDNRKNQALGDLRRLRVWDLYISEKVVLRLPLRFATLVAGDVVTLVSDYVEHLYDNVNPYFIGRYCLVLGVDFSIDDQECIISLGIPSPKMQRTTDSESADDGYNGWLPNDDHDNTDLFVWLDSESNMNETSGDITSWVDRQNNFSFTNQQGNNNTYNTGAGSPSKGVTSSNFNYARFTHSDHEFLATDFNSKMNLSGTDGICIAMLVRAYADPIGDADFNGANYYRTPLVNCGRAYQLNFMDNFSGSTYTNAVQYSNNSNSFQQDNIISPPDNNWKIIIYSSSDVGGYTNEDGLFVNGTRENTSDYPPSNFDMTISPNFRIGRDPDINYSNQTQQFNYAFGSFDLAELLVFSIPLHDSEREKVEGYIAHKYNLTTLLPSNHPYKTQVPT